MEKPEDTIELTAEGLLAFFETGYASSNRGEDDPLDDVLIDGSSYDLVRLSNAIFAAISKARKEAFEEHRGTIQKLYDLLHNDTPHGGAASHLPAGGLDCERMVDEALDILLKNGAIRQHFQKGEKP